MAALWASVALPVGLALTRGVTADRPFVAYWIGLLATANVLLGVSTVVPLTPAVGLTIGGVMAGGALSRPDVRREIAGWRPRPSIAAWGLLGVVRPLAPVPTYDTGLYHYQAVRWLAEHGTVPGLALVHGRFGFVSSWFALAAPLDFSPLEGRQTAVLGALVLVPITLQIAAAAWRLSREAGQPADVVLLVGLTLGAAYAIWTGIGVSLSPDLPLFFIPTVIIATMVRDREASARALWLLAVLGVTLKLSALPLALGVGLWAVVRCREWRWFTGVGAAAVLPLVAAFLVVSGCLLYPIALTCLEPSWGVTRQSAAQMSWIIEQWAKWGASSPPESTSSLGWLPAWFAKRPMSGLVDLTFLASIPVVVVVAVRRRDRRRMLWPAGVAWAGAAFALVMGPDWRFMAGYLAIGISVAAAMVWPTPRWLTVPPVAWTAAAAIPVVATAAIAFRSAVPLLVPPDMPHPPALRLMNADGWSYRVPVDDDRCWSARLPCAPHPIEDEPRLRGDTLDGGFTRTD